MQIEKVTIPKDKKGREYTVGEILIFTNTYLTI